MIRPTDLSDLRIDLEQALSRLTVKQRLVVTLHFSGMKQIDIGESMGVSQPAISQMLRRIRYKNSVLCLCDKQR